MRILTRYILREVITYSLLGGVLFTFVFFMKYLITLMELAVRGNASLADIVRVTGYLLPNLLTLVIPISVLIGILLGLSRLSADSEVTAMRASGMGVPDFLRIMSIFATLAVLVGLVNTLYIAPRATQAMKEFEQQSKSEGVALLVQPRVFYEKIPNFDVVFVQDVLPAQGNTVWRHVFLADRQGPKDGSKDPSDPVMPHVLTAKEAYLQNSGSQQLHLYLEDGTRHDLSPTNANQYDISTFSSTDVPVQTTQAEDARLSRRDTDIKATPTRELLQHLHDKDGRTYAIELQSRISFPFACLVLMLVGTPLGLTTNRGGKGAGFALTLTVVLLYYVLSEVGLAFASQGKVAPFIGVWGANILFTVTGGLLVWHLSRGGGGITIANTLTDVLRKTLRWINARTPQGMDVSFSGGLMQRLRRALHIRFPLILDEYVMRDFMQNFVLVLLTLSSLFIVFTFFELIGDIFKFKTPLVTVGEYLIYLIPFILYNVTPLCALVAVLITFGGLSRTSEMTAMKAAGISLYRLITPVLLVAVILSAALFAFDEFYLPQANRRQEALRSVIKGKPAQTFLRPNRKWMSGQAGPSGAPSRIFYYQFFDPDKDVFANLTVFEFQPGSFALQRRIFAQTVHWDDHIGRWVFENGWQRTFSGETVASYEPFTISTFGDMHEQPSYFKKEDRQSEQMSYAELARYINDLQQSGFDTMRLRVQLNRKLAYPLVTLVMTVLAIPFALSMGKKGNMAGMGIAVGMAISYWVIAGIFENLGNVDSLPAVAAAWSPDLLFAMAGTWLLLRTST